MLFETFASTGGKPSASSVGNVISVPEPTTALIAPAAIPAASSAATSQRESITVMLCGAGQHQLARPLGLHVRRLGGADERPQQAREAQRVVEVGEVARVLEDLELAARHQLVRAAAVRGRDDRVDPAPDEQRRD